MVNIVLVDDHILVRDGIKSYLTACSEKYNLVGEAGNGHEALVKVKELKPELVITDLNMPEMDGLELIKALKKQHPKVKIIVLSMVDEAQYIKQVIKMGANSYLLKNSRPEEVTKAIDAVMGNDTFYSADVTNVIMSQISNGNRTKKPSRFDNEFKLTKREKEILSLILKEYNNGEIADQLFISIRTVDAHKRNMIEKTGSKNIAGLLVWALKNKIIDEDDLL